MHLIALVEGPRHVCCRYRISAFRCSFEQAGHELELRTWPRRLGAWLRLPSRLVHADAVIWQRKLLPPWQRWLLRRAARRLLFDFDDAVFLRDSYALRGLHSRTRARRFAAQVQGADAILAGNGFLAEQAARWAGAGRVSLLPTCVDVGRYSQAAHERAGHGVELVWVGSSSTLRGLEQAAPLLEWVGRSHPGLRLKLVCDRFLALRNMAVLPCAWSEAGEAGAIAAADIGISWVPDDLWSRGKCGLKVLQYMAAGLPVVANPVGVHTDMVRHGETGFLAATAAEWAAAVGRLAADPELRRRMGQAGRQLVERTYSVEAGARRWLALLDGLQARRQSA